MLPTRDSFRLKDTHIEIRGQRTIYNAKGLQKENHNSQTYTKLDFKPKTITKGEEGHSIVIKKSIQQKVLTIINIYAPKFKAHKYKTINNKHKRTHL